MSASSTHAASSTGTARHRAVIIGGGFAGLAAARVLDGPDVDVVLIDRRNHHLFQPLLYQVATGGLSPANIAAPLRRLLRRQRRTRVLLGDVVDIDVAAKQVVLKDGASVPYDDLIVATGAVDTYFGHDDWRAHAPSLKTLEDARRIRHRVLGAFEAAERVDDPAQRQALLTFVVVGGGPTGVELAGAIAEVAYRTLRGEFRALDTGAAKVILLEGADRVLGAFSPRLSTKAADGLRKLGVDVRTDAMVEMIDEGGLVVRETADGDGETLRIGTHNVFWAAGVRASSLGRRLAASIDDLALDHGGRVPVTPHCTVAGHDDLYVIGDLARFEDDAGAILPGLAPVAMQQGRYVAKRIRARLRGREIAGFTYLDKGNMATVGRTMAVAELGQLRFSGLIAWLAWLFIHLLYLAAFENRVLVMIQWGWNYVTRGRSARLISGTNPAERLPADGEAAPS
ncbi:MAG: NAD(P)/FAD-dependent oxidoreductase [Acidobacteriota bacterium]